MFLSLSPRRRIRDPSQSGDVKGNRNFSQFLDENYIGLITLPEDNKAFSFESKFGVHTLVVLVFVSNISSRPKLKLKENTNASLPLSITSQCTNQYFAVLL